MSGMDKLTELLPCPFCGGEADTMTPEADDMRAATVMCMGCYCTGKECETEAQAIAAWNRRASQAVPAPSDHLVSVGKASGMVEARVSLAARQIRQTLRDYGHRCAETSLPDLIAADVDAVLRKQDEIHTPAPSDGLREAETRQGECHLQAMLLAAEVAEACAPSDEWSQETKDTYYFAVRDAARAIRKNAALTPSPAQEGDRT